MKTNELKKGDIVLLNNGWKARIEDNKKGNIRMCTVYGIYQEMGSVYAHDMIKKVNNDGTTTMIEHTADQLKSKKLNAMW